MGHSDSPVSMPQMLFLELTSHCNMHCTFCPSDVLRRSKCQLSEERLQSFLGQVHALNIHVPILLNLLGEPLLNKRIYTLLNELEASGHQVTLITNMTLLADPGIRQELLKHANLTLALSLQTATKRSYKMRGYDRLSFKKFFKLIFVVIEDKFRLGSGTRLEIHVASNYILKHDPTIKADSELNIWPNFQTEKAEQRWIKGMLRRIERLAITMRKRYPEAFAAEQSATLIKYKDHIGTKIALDRASLPTDFHRLKDEHFWGYMPLPNLFLVFKSFELWTRERAFLQASLPSDRFVYVEERQAPHHCSMASNLGLLANGDLAFCCLDYEGEMALGNIDTTKVADVLFGQKRQLVRRDAMAEALCRRCRGDLFIFDTAPLPRASAQIVDKLSRGWWPYEADLDGMGGRWTQGEAWAYVLARIPAHRVLLSFHSPFDANALLRLVISEYDATVDGFPAQTAAFVLPSHPSEQSAFEAVFDFTPGRLYRLEIDSPTFTPDETLHNGDTRRLGLAVYSILLKC